MTIPCPDCRRLHIHTLHCPNPQPLPHYAARPEPVRCPDCSSLTPGAHKPGCPIASATPLPCAVEVEAMRRMYLIEPRTILAMEAALSDEDLEAAR